MARKKLTVSAKLLKLEKHQQKNIERVEKKSSAKHALLLESRKKELTDIFRLCGALTIDNDFLSGVLEFITNPKNHEHEILQKCRKNGKKNSKKLRHQLAQLNQI